MSPNAHDFNGNGTPDLLQIDRAGKVHRYDTSYDAATGKVSAKAPVVAATNWPQGQRITGTGNDAAPFAPARKQAGPSGWGVYWSFALGDFAGDKAADIVAVDSRGDLWLHQGKGDGTFANRTKVGRGRHVYESVLNVGDADRDGKADLMGFTRNGTAAFYKGTHDAAKPFGAARPVPLNAISDPWVDGFYF
ncbi:VCBS repeat-containing protein [Streptomyces sp. WAC08241]|uniref:FG-GAP repeat domain-containing protein n=1 Tax=Streptomyces sp. WAC08241 TaxID=2487421 RepID=UPI00163BEDA8|nr:VCBS repeat-containing protein [Streptomyces sp. WAC08241]